MFRSHPHLILFAVMAIAPLHAEDQSTVRSWKSATGSVIEAALVTTDGKSVTLKTTDGRTITVAIAQLSAPDREYLATVKPPSQPNQAAPAATPTTGSGKSLPLQTGDSGPFHALFESGHFRAVIDAQGGMTVLLNQGKAAEPRRFARIQPVLKAPGAAGGSDDLKAIAFSQFAPATRQPSAVSFSAEYRDGLKIDFRYAFTETTISTWFRVAELGTWRKEDLPFSLTHWISAFTSYAPDPKLIEEDYLKKHRFKYVRWDSKHLEKNRISQSFFEVKSISGVVDEITMNGPAFGKGEIKFESPTSDHTQMSVWSYTDTAVDRGFSVYLGRKKDGTDLNSSDFDKEKLTVSFK